MAILTRSPSILFALTLGALLLGAGVGGCLQADSRGNEAPDEVQVGTPPLWTNGVRELMVLKCAVCHQTPRPEWAPTETPGDFDLRYHVTAPGGRDGAQSIIDAIATDHILRGGGGGEDEEQMPPLFATPLTTQELDALETWAGNGGP